ncbi:signal transduction histidine kinase [Algoriphagus zhangzhouensis]|uniref:Oxygen sensor histidine kinase NreB n=2 Tax=Algoriphagus zhangzhouensis TaxID=1073327 RepID=A0A1M7ZJD8_9BACT|nr:signal transduction histidine kinase [Algoriphagus zhangzhouensis]SHO65035.1 Signal transduction histidine kinase [Algoriphagus zhangzhouensis]
MDFPPFYHQKSSFKEVRTKQFFRKMESAFLQLSLPTDEQLVGILITGKDGIGKSFLTKQYLKSNSYQLLISDQTSQLHNIPYSALKGALGPFLSEKIKRMNSGEFSRFSKEVRTVLGAEFSLLSEYLPELSLLLDSDSNEFQSQLPKVESQLYLVFRKFFECLSKYFKSPLVWLVDDFQWIDGSTSNLIQYLLANLDSSVLSLVAVADFDESDQNKVSQLLNSLAWFHKHIHTIHLDFLEDFNAKELIENRLGGSVNEELAQLLNESSEGLPSTLILILETLILEDLIQKKKGKWNGDIDLISQRLIGEKKDHLLNKIYESLSSLQKEILGMVACVKELDLKRVRKIFSNHDELGDSLKKLFLENFLSLQNDKLFIEEAIREAVLSNLGKEEIQKFHLALGEQLLNEIWGEKNVSELVILAQHFQQVAGYLQTHQEKERIIKLMVQVAKIQREEHSFSQAKGFLTTARDLLKGEKWTDKGDLIGHVWLERARVEYYMGEFDVAEILLDELLEQNRDSQLRFLAFELKIIVNNHLGRYRKSVFILTEILNELGLRLPSVQEQIEEEIRRLEIGIASDALPEKSTKVEIGNQSKILQLLYNGGMALHHTSDLLMTWAALQIISRSQIIDQPNVRSLGLVSFGRMKIISGQIEEGFDLGLHGLNLNNSIGDIQYRSRVLGVFGFYILPWKEGYHLSYPLLEEGMAAARKSGDQIAYYINKTHLFNLHFLSGKPIEDLLKFDFKESYVGMELTYYITHYQKELFRYISGRSPFLSLPKQEARGLAARLTLQEEKFYRNYVLARYYFMFGYYSQAIESSSIAEQNQKLQEGSPLVPANLILKALAITQNWANLGKERVDEMDWLDSFYQMISSWNDKSPSNFASHFWLLKAELGRIKSIDFKEVEDAYIHAIQGARDNVYQKAICHELFAKFYLENKNIVSASTHLQHAMFHYHQWGATRKIEQLVRQYAFIIPKKSQKRESLDIENILFELAGEIHSIQIARTLMVLLMRISASTKSMILWVNPDGDLQAFHHDSLLNFEENQEEDSWRVLSELFRMVHRTKKPLVLNQLEKHLNYPELDSILKKGVKSSLFFPVGFSENHTMVVYMESQFDSNAYSEDILRWIRIVSRQGGVILDNARNFENTLRLNEEVQKKMEEKQALMTLLEKQKDSHIKDLIKVQEYERERIAGELHDSLGSQLSTLKLNLTHIFDSSGKDSFKSEGLKSLKKLDEAIDEVRRIAHHMSPVSLKRFGLELALQALLEPLSQQTTIQTELQILGLEERLEAQLELAVYRICQELIQNVLKHSKAEYLRLQIIRHFDSVNISIEDNGVGIQKSKEEWGMGLLGIETKVQMLNGEFQIESQPGKGCLVMIDIPN